MKIQGRERRRPVEGERLLSISGNTRAISSLEVELMVWVLAEEGGSTLIAAPVSIKNVNLFGRIMNV